MMDSGADWTIIRASWFNQNFSEGYLLDPILDGYVTLPVANIGEPFIDADDIADVAVAPLTEAGHTGQLYDSPGPRLLTSAEAVSEIARATGRPIQYGPCLLIGYVSALAGHGVPAEYVALLTYLFSDVMDGRNASLTNDVARVLGRKPTDFADYVQKTANSSVWGQ